ncbi:MAG: S8 family serine peptidase, partial [bacterium]|nr:S8 family serine peptidase [bacterium]
MRHVAAGEASLTVAWTPAEGAAGMVGYDIRYIESSSTNKNNDARWTVLSDVWSGGNLTAVIAGLTDYTAYDVAVRARTSSLTSAWSSSVAGLPADPGPDVAQAVSVHSEVPLHANLTPDDVDFYTFTVTTASEFVIWTTGDTDTLGELTRSDGSSHDPPIFSDNWRLEPGPNNFMITGSITPGTYFFKVSQGARLGSATVLWQNTGPYTLHIHWAEDTTDRADARTVTLGSTAVGLLTGDDPFALVFEITPDRDIFELVLPTATTISAHVEAPALDTIARILDESGKEISRNDFGGLDVSGNHFAFRAVLPAGKFYIQIAESLRLATPYFLHVNESPDPAATRAAAQTLAMQTVAGGTATQNSDALLRIVLSEQTPIALRGRSAVDEMSVELQDASGDPLDIGVYQDVVKLPLEDVHTFLIREVLEAGTYYLNVKFDNPGSTGEFLILLQPDHRYARQARQCPEGQLGVTDSLHGCQWHLRNAGQLGGVAGEDINLGAVWTTTKGAGIKVTVVDEGIDFLHSDLSENFDMSTSGSAFGEPAEELLKEFSSHGTQAAGLIAARDNGVGVVGVAPRATLSAYQIFGPHSEGADEAGLIEAVSFHAPEISIRNHSWTPRLLAPRQVLSAGLIAALELSRTTGDGGRGTLQIQAAGNDGRVGGYSSHNRYLTDRSFLAVCGVDRWGNYAQYSRPGPNLWVCASTEGGRTDDQGLATTFREGTYHLDFDGTSASAPLVSGVAALVRAANRDLSWRDTKLILADSARVVNSGDSSWADGGVKYSDPSERYRYSHKMGFGAVDADRAVALARNWKPLPDERSASGAQNTPITVSIGAPTATSTLSIPGPVSFVEHVEFQADMAALTFRDLTIELTSPSGTTSVLSVPHGCIFPFEKCDASGPIVMSSTRHLGEDPRGEWTLSLQTVGGFAAVNSWSLKVYGHEREAPASLSVSPTSVTEGGSFTYTIELGQAPGAGNRVTVNFITAGGTATAGEDYTPVIGVGPKAVSFGPAETSKTVMVNTLRGAAGHDEDPETLLASISRVTRYEGSQVLGTELRMAPQTVSVTIHDHPDDHTPVWFEAAAPGVTKNGLAAQFVARIVRPAAADIAVPYATQVGSGMISFYDLAVSPAQTADFTPELSGTVTIKEGDTSAEFTVATADDQDSAYEFFQVRERGSAPAGTAWRPGTQGGTTADMIIEPDSAAKTIYVVAVPQDPQEGESVELSAHFAQGVSVGKRRNITVAAMGENGAAADDFTLVEGAIRIASGESHSRSPGGRITIAADSDYDPGETIVLAGTSDRGSDVKTPTVAIENTTPLTANLAFTDPNEDGIVVEGGSVGVTVSLAGALSAGEMVDVVLRLPHDVDGTILGDATLVSAGGGETGFSVHSALADITRRHPDTNREITYQEMTVRFADAGARSGTLLLTLGDDGVAADPMLTIPLRIAAVTGAGLGVEVAAGALSILLVGVDTEEGVLIEPRALEIAEGGTATYQVSLRSDPGGTATVTIMSDNEAGARASDSLLTFTSNGAGIWSTPQTVTVTAVEDADGFDATAGITHRVSGYGEVIAGSDVRVTVVDDDVAAYNVSSDWSLIPSGVGVGQSFRLVMVTSEETRVSSDTVGFYNRFVERLVAGGHQDIQAYARGFRAWLSTAVVDARDNTHTNPTGDGAGHPVYWLGAATKVANNNTDLYQGWDASGPGRDEQGNSVDADTTAWWGSKTNGSRSVGAFVDADGSSVRLTDIGNPTDATRAGNKPNRQNRLLALSPVFTVVEKPEITITSQTHQVTEGAEVLFTVSADSAPSTDLTVLFVVGESTGSNFLASEHEGNRSLIIPAGARSATITLRTVADRVDEPEGQIAVILQTGTGYTLGSPLSHIVTVVDDDDAGVTIAESGVPADTVVAENGGTDSYTVVLDSRPTHDVVVTVTSQTPLAAVVNRSGGTKGPVQTLTFTPSGWNTAQTVIVEGVPDVLDNTNNRRTVDLLHEISSTDPSYHALSDQTVEVMVTDDDGPPTIALSVSPAVVGESGGATDITVTATLSGSRFDVDRVVAVSVSGSGGSGVVGFDPVAGFNLLIPARQGVGETSFTLTPEADGTVENHETVTVSGVLSGVTVTSASVSLVDDDGAAGVTIAESGVPADTVVAE